MVLTICHEARQKLGSWYFATIAFHAAISARRSSLMESESSVIGISAFIGKRHRVHVPSRPHKTAHYGPSGARPVPFCAPPAKDRECDRGPTVALTRSPVRPGAVALAG